MNSIPNSKLNSLSAIFRRELTRLLDKVLKNVTLSQTGAVRYQNARNFLLKSQTRVRWETLDSSKIPVVIERNSGKSFRICVINRAAGYQNGF